MHGNIAYLISYLASCFSRVKYVQNLSLKSLDILKYITDRVSVASKKIF